MKALILFVGWCILFVLCWPIALLALILFPVVWLLSLPLRLVGITVSAVFALLREYRACEPVCWDGRGMSVMQSRPNHRLCRNPSVLSLQ